MSKLKRKPGRPRVEIPAEVYELAQALADLKHLGDPSKGIPLEPERHAEGFVSNSPDPDAFRRWARNEHDAIRKQLARTAKRIEHKLWCRPEDYEGKSECPSCGKPLRRRRPIREIGDDDGSLTRAD